MSGSSVSPTVPLVLTGVPIATLQAWLLAAQTALHNLQTGQQATTVSYSQGDGQKLVTYQRTNEAALRMHIQELTQALGLGRGRRAIGVRFP